jgi:hypothetical protein
MMQKLRIWSMAAKISRKKRIAETENVILCLPNKIMPLQLVIFLGVVQFWRCGKMITR